MAANNLHFDRIVFATSSGGTQAGLLVGNIMMKLPVLLDPISIDQTKKIDKSIGMTFRQFVFDIVLDLNKRLNLNLDLKLEDFELDTDYLGEGYGIVGNVEREAVKLLASTGGLPVDPVYSGRALGGSIAKIRRGDFQKGENILFWHTGGETALHAHVPEMTGTY